MTTSTFANTPHLHLTHPLDLEPALGHIEQNLLVHALEANHLLMRSSVANQIFTS